MSGPAPAVLQIDVVSDVVCPWCYIGKRQLEAALERWQAANPELAAPTLRWRPFQLNPEIPAAGIPRSDYLRRKFGASDGGNRYERVIAAARTVGLEMEMDAIQVQPNTLKAHGLLELAAESGRQEALAEALFQAYFIGGRNLSDDQVLAEIATGVGLAQEPVAAALSDPGCTQAVAAADAEMRQSGVNGVPLFIIGNPDGNQLAISGAQGADALLAAMRQVQVA